MTSHSKGGALNDFATTFEYRGKGGVKKLNISLLMIVPFLKCLRSRKKMFLFIYKVFV